MLLYVKRIEFVTLRSFTVGWEACADRRYRSLIYIDITHTHIYIYIYVCVCVCVFVYVCILILSNIIVGMIFECSLFNIHRSVLNDDPLDHSRSLYLALLLKWQAMQLLDHLLHNDWLFMINKQWSKYIMK